VPIKNLSNPENVDIQAALPLIAKIKKGDEKPETGNRPGKDLDYFRVVFEPAFAHLEPAFRELFGDEPRSFPRIALPPTHIDNVFPNWMQAFRGNHTLKTQCDGEQQVLHWVESEGYSRKPLPCQRKADGTCSLQCNERGYLYFIIPEFSAAVGVLGFFRLDTSSPLDIKHVYSVLSTTQSFYGAINATSYSLTRIEKNFTPMVKGKPASVSKWMLLLTSNHDAQPKSTAGLIEAPSHAPALPDAIAFENEGIIEGQAEDGAGFDTDAAVELLHKVEEASLRHLGMSLEELLESLHLDSPIDLIRDFPTWEDVCKRVTALIVEESLPVRVYGVKTQQRNEGDGMEYSLPFGFNLVKVYGREAFQTHTGFDARADYSSVNEEDLDGAAISRNLNFTGTHFFADAFGREYLHVTIALNGNKKLAVERISDPLSEIPM
jgi:hypothetical protein